MSTQNKTEKKKKSLVKRILKWSGITFLVLLILLIALPLIFQKRIFQAVLEEANKSLTADVSIEDYDLKILSTFPNLILELKEVKISGSEEFHGVDLIDASSIEAKLNIKSLFSDQIKIERIKLKDANINVLITKDGKANYDITISDSVEVDTEPSKFAISLKNYAIENTNINFDDQEGGLKMVMTNLNHQGSGDLTEEIVDFETTTTIDALTLISGGVPLLLTTHTEAIFNLLMEPTENGTKFTLKENELKLNDFTTSYTGFVEAARDYLDFDIKLDASKATFASFISLIPSVYRTGYESMITQGSFKMDGFLKGKLTETIVPGFLFSLKVDNAAFAYPDLPAGFKNIHIDGLAKRDEGSNLDNTVLEVKRFDLDFLQNTVRSDFKLATMMSDPNMSMNLIAKVDLGTLDKVMPMLPGESYKGKMDADMHFKGKMSAIEQERYENFHASGLLKLMGFEYRSPDFTEPIMVNEAAMAFSPRFLALTKCDLKIGKSDLKMDGRVDNYMAYVFRDELLHGSFNLVSNYMNLNDLMGVSADSGGTAEKQGTAATTNEDSYVVPSNLDVNLNASIGQLDYDGMTFKNIKGNVGLKESVATMKNVQMNAFGGTMSLDGSYDSRNPKEPKVDLDYGMSQIDIKQLANQFLTIEKLMPVIKHVDGKINTNFSINSKLTNNLDFILESLTGNGKFSASMLQIGNFEPLNKLSNELRMPHLSSQTLKNIATSFNIKDGKVHVQPFNFMMDKIKIEEVKGWTALNQDINYTMKMMVPKEMIPNDMVKFVEQGLGQLGGVAKKLNIGGLPNFIPVAVNVGGTATKPTIKTDFRESIMKLTGSLKDNVTNLVNEAVDKAKDSIKGIVTDKVEEVKSDLIERKNKLMAEAQKQADEVKALAKTQADRVRSEADKQANDLVAKANNPAAKLIAERSAKEIRDRAESQAKKIENEADKRTDQIMSEARARADKLQ